MYWLDVRIVDIVISLQATADLFSLWLGPAVEHDEICFVIGWQVLTAWSGSVTENYFNCCVKLYVLLTQIGMALKFSVF